MAIENPSTSNHIAMWSCPRSRSTLIARSFGQLDGCIVYDEPLYAPYLVDRGFDHPERERVLACRETDYERAIGQLIGDLPPGTSFSFQKHIAKHFKPEKSSEWLKSLRHFFLIRHPQEIIYSYQKICPSVTESDIGMAALVDVFKKIQSFSDLPPLVVDANDLLKNPQAFLTEICLYLDIPFSEKMLTWECGLPTNLEMSDRPFPWLWTGELPLTSWYTKLDRSTGFLPFDEEREINLPDALKPVLESCLPLYHELSKYRLCLENP